MPPGKVDSQVAGGPHPIGPHPMQTLSLYTAGSGGRREEGRGRQNNALDPGDPTAQALHPLQRGHQADK